MGEVESERIAIRSPVNWTLLGLIIERPSYAYELSQRFTRIYGNALSLSSASHVYRVLGTLQRGGLIEEIPGTRTGRQPRPHYRATAAGLSAYHEWLIDQVAAERRRQKVFLLQLTALAREPEQALRTLSEYEQACLRETCDTAIAAGGEATNGALELQRRLIAEERRLATGAKIQWARFARSEVKALAARQAAAGAHEPEPGNADERARGNAEPDPGNADERARGTRGDGQAGAPGNGQTDPRGR